MRVSENLKTAVAEENIDDVRGCLWSCITVDMSMKERFKDSFDYVLSNGRSELTEKLFEEDDGKFFNTDATKDNFYELSSLLSVNFSRKKLDALQQMADILYPSKTEMKESKKNQGSSKTKKKYGKKICTVIGSGIGVFSAAKVGAKIGGIIGGGIIGACLGAAIGFWFSKSSKQGS